MTSITMYERREPGGAPVPVSTTLTLVDVSTRKPTAGELPNPGQTLAERVCLFLDRRSA
jgi:hypothetical protein